MNDDRDSGGMTNEPPDDADDSQAEGLDDAGGPPAEMVSHESVEPMTDAETELAERLAADLSRVLGTGVVVEDLELADERPARVRVVCLIEGHVREITAEGETVQAAMREVIAIAARLRLDSAWWQIVGPT